MYDNVQGGYAMKKIADSTNRKFDHFLDSVHCKNIIIVLFFMTIATSCSLFIDYFTHNILNTSIIFMLAIVAIAHFATGYIAGIVASIIGVIVLNLFFTYQHLESNYFLADYPIVFVGMLTISIFTSATTTQMKEQAKIITEREKLLMEVEKEKMRANLLRAISHDLRTPLTSIIGASSTYLENSTLLTEDEKNDLVRNIEEDSQWLINMVENLLSVTRIHDQSATVNKSLESVEEVVSEAVQKLKKRIPTASIKAKVPDELILIPMDAMLIEQVILNLLENAVVHSHSKKPIECVVDYDDTYVSFNVIDYGIGIREEYLESIFDGYYTNNFTDSSRGMGIGLSICKTIIRSHGGTIKAINHKNGAIFTFQLPMEDMNYDE